MKIKTLFIAITISTSLSSFGQVYKGGNEAIFKLILGNLKYPAQDRRDGTTGKVLIKFTVRDGSVDSLEIINHVSPTIDSEASRILLLTNGNWLIKSSEHFLFPLNFELDAPTNQKGLISKRDKLIDKRKYPDAIIYSEQIKKLNPNDIDNLDKLIMMYSELRQLEKAKDTKYLREQIQTLRSIFKVN